MEAISVTEYEYGHGNGAFHSLGHENAHILRLLRIVYTDRAGWAVAILNFLRFRTYVSIRFGNTVCLMHFEYV